MLYALQWVALPALVAGVCILAWMTQAKAETYAGLLILAANLVADGLLALVYPHFPSAGMCVIDFLLACGLLSITLLYSNYWLGAAMLLQSAALCMQALDLAGDGPSTLVHIMANNVISYTMVACLLAGVLGSWRTRRARLRPPAPVGLGA